VGNNKFIPNAGGFPLSLTEFTPDQTGRVKRQGGVGTDFQLGSGHETKFYYGKPDQTELDRLFGNEVGYASHYQKNMVVDPNGQVSVSYVDAHGRTVATALAGDKPAGMMDVTPVTTATSITMDLMNNIREATSLTSTYTLLVSSTTTPTFNYNVLRPSNQYDPFCKATNVCYDCLYDLNIKVDKVCTDGSSFFTPSRPPIPALALIPFAALRLRTAPLFRPSHSR
jgi:hypothetical protein